MRILVLGGPNLNLLGQREPEVYGRDSLKDIENYINSSFKNKKYEALWFQTNSESELIYKIQSAEKDNFDALIINPAAFTHTSVAIHDALKCFRGPKIEVHLSNTYQREEFRKVKLTSGASDGIIEGFGKDSYWLAFSKILKESGSN